MADTATIVIEVSDTTYYLTKGEARRLATMPGIIDSISADEAWQLSGEINSLLERHNWRREGF